MYTHRNGFVQSPTLHYKGLDSRPVRVRPPGAPEDLRVAELIDSLFEYSDDTLFFLIIGNCISTEKNLYLVQHFPTLGGWFAPPASAVEPGGGATCI